MTRMAWRNPSLLFIIININIIISFCLIISSAALGAFSLNPKEKRRTLALTDSGVISAVDINDGYRRPYHIQFITMEPNSLFLPVLLQADMLFYVHSGRGRLGWVDDEDKHYLGLQRGDIYRLKSGSVFYVQSHADPAREKLRIYALFTNRITENSIEMIIGAYSTLSDLVLGFDKKVLQMAFKVSPELIEGIMGTTKPASIIHMPSRNETERPDWKAGIIEAIVGGGSTHGFYNGKQKQKAFNILKRKPDFKNCNGWSLAVNYKDFHALKGSDIGFFMVNLTKGSMMGPHWNPMATELTIVVHGQGMVQIVCPTDAPQCENSRFRVKEGDVFAIPRFHPMAQISFNNDSLVFVGFSTMPRKNRPQFLAGTRSVLRTIDEDILAMSFGIPNTTIRQFLASQRDAVILECTSCAEEEEKTMEEEERKKRQEEERKREEEEAKRKKEEEAASKREEEERQRQEEEAAKRQEEERQRREEEEEVRRRKEEEEEAKKRHEEEAAREEEEARRQEEERQRRQRREEEEARRMKKEEATARREKEEARRQEEERRERQEREAEEAKRKEEEQEGEVRRREEEGRGGGGEEEGKGGGREEEGEQRARKKMWKT